MRGIQISLTIVAFDGINLVKTVDTFNFKKNLIGSIATKIKNYINGDFLLELLNIVDLGKKLQLNYLSVVDYDEIKDEYLEHFEKLDKKDEKELFKKLSQIVENLDPVFLRTLLGSLVTIDDIHYIYEFITNKKVDKGNFHKLVKSKNWLEPTDKFLSKVKHRPPRLYKIKIKH